MARATSLAFPEETANLMASSICLSYSSMNSWNESRLLASSAFLVMTAGGVLTTLYSSPSGLEGIPKVVWRHSKKLMAV